MADMTISKLIESLLEIQKGVGPDAPVRFAAQPSWPMEYEISEVAATEPTKVDGDFDAEGAVYLSEGRQIGYLPSKVQEAFEMYRD
ncbi:hypothetical protein ACFVWN_20385 [Nocardiopsis flavescens]|uniref:hypothetical protein n=1 Tax=Nocardiopsis flavescens TaxID=758803 RepID=UPI00364C8EBC